VVVLVAATLAFFLALRVIELALGLVGEPLVSGILGATSSPLLALVTGMLATSLIQSSSTVTSLTVALVASGVLPVEMAVFVVMGSNVGTTVTNTVVAMGHVTRPEEFRRAMAGATVHDVFNAMAVALLVPLELAFGVLSGPAQALEAALAGVGGARLLSPLGVALGPVAEGLIQAVGSTGWLALVLGGVLLFGALRVIVAMLRALVLGRSAQALDRFVFGRPLRALAFGGVLTFLVQSSSVTTSLVVPLLGAGLLTVRQVFPYMLGANVGTTLTALLAALAVPAGAGATAALTVAFAHVLFNAFGALAIYGLPVVRDVPVRVAEWIGEAAYRNRAYAVAYVVLGFYGVPLVLEVLLR
jgi:sodium-dependent phosphate cotransporter